MKVFNILSLVTSVVLTVKVSAADECFSTKLNYPCCKETNEVIYVDKDGEWGVENNNWCGMTQTTDSATVIIPENILEQQPQNNTTVDTTAADTTTNTTTNTTVITTAPTITSDYMSKLKVVNTCPPEAITKQSGVEYPTPKKVYYPSKTTNSDRPLNIILPTNYDESKKYPVLYLLHGIMGNEDSMLDATMGSITIPTNLAKEGKAKEMIIVLPNEYAPEGGKEVTPAFNQEFFDGYDNFINDLVGSIMPYMEANYSILTGRENTAICGFSMGGRNSLYIGYKRPDLFGYVGAFSPAPGVTPGTDFSGYHKGLFTEDSFRAEIPPFVTLVSCGTHDSVVGQFPKSYHEILSRNNQEHIWFEIPGADHDGVAVSAGYYNFISAVFGALN
ncbi:carbohydrate esterase family 1 protein [Neocallimastix lanati (nom. inval.)]|nr:carbohydrate esterase family 1 protein [Neocallimastix sp. JGI-2020a]